MEEERDRLRSRNRADQQVVTVNIYGLDMLTSQPTENLGTLTTGLDRARDEVDSDSSSHPVQGPVADDSSCDWVGIFLQTRYPLAANIELTAGVCYGYCILMRMRVASAALWIATSVPI